MNGRFYMLQKRRFVSIFFVPHSRPKFGMLPVWQNHLCFHQWNTDGELSMILCIQSTLKKEEVVLYPERACAPGRTLHVISEREEHSSWIGKNLRPSLTLLTFPIWTHSSLVFVEIVKVVSDQEVFDCPDLYSTQEEADTRMILQALHEVLIMILPCFHNSLSLLSACDAWRIIRCSPLLVCCTSQEMNTPVNCGFKWETLLVLRTVVGFYLFMNYVLLSQKSHVEFFLPHMLSPWIGKNLRPSLTLITFPIWTHSSLVYSSAYKNKYREQSHLYQKFW
jgi:hypothetical protein